MNNREKLSEKSNPEKKEKVYNQNIKEILQLNLFLLSYDKGYFTELIPPRDTLQERHL